MGGGSHTSSEWYQPEGREVGLRRILLVLAALCDGDDHDAAPSESLS